MTRDQVIELAKQAGINAHPGWPNTAFLERFATLVRNSVLEEAAQKCESGWGNLSGDECAQAIRAMKETI
jgi:hypothetical protein